MFTGAARLSSVDVVRCRLAPEINANPCFIFYIEQFSNISDKITGTKTSHHDPNIVGYRRATYT